MIPYYYRRLLKNGFNEKICKGLWAEKWDLMKISVMSLLRYAMPIDISPILDILNAENERETIQLFPPWNIFYFEKPFSFNEDILCKLEMAKDPNVLQRLISFQKKAIRIDGLLVATGIPPNINLKEKAPEGYFYSVFGINYATENKNGAMVTYMFMFAADKEGNLVWNRESGEILVNILKPNGQLSDYIFPKNDLDVLLNQDMQADIHAICRFINFMQCKNIKVRRMNFPDYKPRKKQKHKVFKYYELVVTKPSINVINQQHGEGIKGKALHTVRGHVKHYTIENPLFGIPALFGDFFIPQHVRGDLEYGNINKTYKVAMR